MRRMMALLTHAGQQVSLVGRAGKSEEKLVGEDRTRGVFRFTVRAEDPAVASELLAARALLSKTRIKDAMSKGAVWLAPVRGSSKRLRRATASLRVGDRIELHYDAELLARTVPDSILIADRRHYSVWFKAAGVLAQGTKEGDHCSLLRHAELYFKPPRPVFLVHRLDREAAGLMVVAHSRDAAARLSALFQGQGVFKRYQVQVRGCVEPAHGAIDFPLDGKAAHTEYRREAYDAAANVSTLSVLIATGRLHQIRRHLAQLGFPVMGDPQYGTGNKNTEGLQLAAVQLRFVCPFSREEFDVEA